MRTFAALCVASFFLVTSLYAQTPQKKARPKLGAQKSLELPSGGGTGFSDFKAGLGQNHGGSYGSENAAASGTSATAPSSSGGKPLESGGVKFTAGDVPAGSAGPLTNVSGDIPGSAIGPRLRCPTSCPGFKGGLKVSPAHAELSMLADAQIEVSVKGISDKKDTCACYQVLKHPGAPQAVKDSPDCSKLENLQPFAEGNEDWKWKDGAWTGTVHYGDDLYGTEGILVRTVFFDKSTCASGQGDIAVVAPPPAPTDQGFAWECTADKLVPPPQEPPPPLEPKRENETDMEFYGRVLKWREAINSTPAMSAWNRNGGWVAECNKEVAGFQTAQATVGGIAYTVYPAGLMQMPHPGGMAHGKFELASAKEGIAVAFNIRGPESYGSCTSDTMSPAAMHESACLYTATISKTPGGPPAGENCTDGPSRDNLGFHVRFGGTSSLADRRWSCILPPGRYYCNVTTTGYDDPLMKRGRCGGLVGSPMIQH